MLQQPLAGAREEHPVIRIIERKQPPPPSLSLRSFSFIQKTTPSSIAVRGDDEGDLMDLREQNYGFVP